MESPRTTVDIISPPQEVVLLGSPLNNTRSTPAPSPSPSPSEQLGPSATEQYYEENGRSRVVLITLSIGLKKSDGNELIDVNNKPWKSEAKSSIKPKAKDLKEEVKRRTTLKDVRPIPRPNAWSVPELMEWLTNNPIQNFIDVRFLMQEAEQVRDMILAAQQEQQLEEVALQGADWWGNIPYLCLIHCLAEDHIKQAYLRRHDPWNRHRLDTQNSESRPPTVYEVIADCWNSSAFNPSTQVSECHYDFLSPIGLEFLEIQIFQVATARKVEDKLTQLRASLTRIIAKWEKSGQGDGGYLDSDDEESVPCDIINEDSHRFGVLQDRPQFALDTWSVTENGG